MHKIVLLELVILTIYQLLHSTNNSLTQAAALPGAAYCIVQHSGQQSHEISPLHNPPQGYCASFGAPEEEVQNQDIQKSL